MSAKDNLELVVDDVQNMLTLGSNFSALKSNLSIVGKVVDTAQPFLPLIGTVIEIACRAVEIYENAKHNKNICASLMDRVSIAKNNVEIIQRHQKFYKEKFKINTNYKALYRFAKAIEKIEFFMDKVSNLSGLKKYALANSVQENFNKLIAEFDECTKDLQFTVTISNEEQRRLDQENLENDIEEMKQFLKKIEGGVTDNESHVNTIFTEVKIINDKLDNLKDHQFRAIKINPKELEDPPNEKINPETTIKKKLYRGNEVACKPTISELGSQRIQTQLVIIGKLKDCPNILKFYGLSSLDDNQVMVFEWAEKGNLKELYESNDIDWDGKVRIALDICRGLVFLHSCDILHHDIRCQNIMMTSRLEPKISNFKYSRETDQDSIQIDNVNDMIRWMAPERLGKKWHKYDFKCEIFSFGMLLWELAFEKIPYENMKDWEIIEHVKKGDREKISFGQVNPDHRRIQKGLKEIITAAWEGNLHIRITLAKIFLKLDQLSDKQCHQTTLYSDGTLDFDGSKPDVQQPDGTKLDVQEPTSSTLEQFDSQFYIPDIPIKPLEDGIAAHRKKNYETAWNIFEYHAELGDSSAKYWKAYYLAEGHVVNKDLVQAAGLFKEAADDDNNNNNADACFRYAFMMFNSSSGVKLNRNQFAKYLTKAADGGNAMAQYNLGDMYLNGKLGFTPNTDLGIRYLKLAALNDHPTAKEVLEKKNININE